MKTLMASSWVRVAAIGWSLGVVTLGMTLIGSIATESVSALSGQVANALSTEKADSLALSTFEPAYEAEPLPILASLPGSYYPEPGLASDPSTGRADFSEALASDRMATVGGAVLTQMLGVQHRDPESGVDRGPVLVEGRAIQLSDLTLVEFRFLPGAEKYTTVVKTTGGFHTPTDAWIAVWTRDGVSVPEWSMEDATVMVAVVMKDGTGTIHSIQAGRADPPTE